MTQTPTLQFDPRSIRDRIQSLEAVDLIVRRLLSPDPELASTACLIRTEDGRVKDYPLLSQELLTFAQRGLADAIRRGREQETRLESAKNKRRAVKKECLEWAEKLRTALGNSK